MLKLVNNNHYHIWTDALHARALAHETEDRWDKGTYVRWTVLTAWIALEIACQDALEENKISYNFKENLDKAIDDKSLPRLDWGSGIWQQVSNLRKCRNSFTHRFLSQQELFLDTKIADEAIVTVRAAIQNIYAHVGKESPAWINDDFDRGWAKKGGPQGFGIMQVGPYPGFDFNAPDNIKISFVSDGKEYEYYTLPANSGNSEIDKSVKDLFMNPPLIIHSVKVYKGKELLKEIDSPYSTDSIRGARHWPPH